MTVILFSLPHPARSLHPPDRSAQLRAAGVPAKTTVTHLQSILRFVQSLRPAVIAALITAFANLRDKDTERARVTQNAATAFLKEYAALMDAA